MAELSRAAVVAAAEKKRKMAVKTGKGNTNLVSSTYNICKLIT